MKHDLLEEPRILEHYRVSTEKRDLCKILSGIFEGRKFEKSLDVGAGSGESSMPLIEVTDQATLLEINKFYEPILKGKYPSAEVVIQDVNLYQLNNYDLIQYSHGLYYHPVEHWENLILRLLNVLNKNGILVVVMNSESGDWWNLVNHFRNRDGYHFAFYYDAWNELKHRLRDSAKVAETNFSYLVSFENLQHLLEYTKRSCLSLKIPIPLHADDEIIKYFNESLDIQSPSNRISLNFNCDIIVLEKSSF